MDLSITKHQKMFCDAKAFEVLYGGAAGGGKSYGQLIDALLYAMRYPGSKQIIFRRTFPELEKSLIRNALSIYPGEIYNYSRTVHTGTFVNGSLIDFAYCDSENDVFKYQSAEYDVIRFDELTHFTEQMYVYLISRCRGANNYPKHIKSTTNPGGIGHSWVKSRFIDIGAPDTVHTVSGNTRIFIPAKLTDNRFLMLSDPDYAKRLESLSERDKLALLHGCWDIEEGRFFQSFDRKLHVIRPFRVTDDYIKYITLDYGLDMLAAYKIAVDSHRRAFVTDELYTGKDNGGDGLIVSDAARELKKLIAGDDIRTVFAPPDLWNRQKDSGKSIAALFHENGISLTRAPNSRVAGWLELKEWLMPYVGEDGSITARLRIFDRCINLIRTMSSIQCDQRNPGDCAGYPHELTHAPDALRYFVSGSPKAAPVKLNRYKYGFEFEKPSRSGVGPGSQIKII